MRGPDVRPNRTLPACLRVDRSAQRTGRRESGSPLPGRYELEALDEPLLSQLRTACPLPPPGRPTSDRDAKARARPRIPRAQTPRQDRSRFPPVVPPAGRHDPLRGGLASDWLVHPMDWPCQAYREPRVSLATRTATPKPLSTLGE